MRPPLRLMDKKKPERGCSPARTIGLLPMERVLRLLPRPDYGTGQGDRPNHGRELCLESPYCQTKGHERSAFGRLAINGDPKTMAQCIGSLELSYSCPINHSLGQLHYIAITRIFISDAPPRCSGVCPLLRHCHQPFHFLVSCPSW